MKAAALWCCCLLMAAPAFAQTPLQLDLTTTAEVVVGPGLSSKETGAFSARSSLLEAKATLQVNSDGKYGADIANFSSSKSFFDNYFFLDEGYIALHSNPIEFQIGRYAQADAFDSPYSLFLNSNKLSAMGMRFKYDDPLFSYESRWIELNNRSKLDNAPKAWREDPLSSTTSGGFPDRGANIKTFLFKFGSLKVGLQDAAIYTGRSFDLEYFASPMPEYFTQYVKNTSGRPWSTGSNENNLIGFFVNWTQPTYTLGFQALVDDFSLHFLFPNDVPNNPWKAAWTFGGQFKTDIGRFGIFHAGALKYTFAPITTQVGQDAESAYGYTYYPDVEYSVGNGKFRALSIEDNSLGYQYGENNLAIRLTYDNRFNRELAWNTNVEFLVAGANSPANPWQEYTSSEQAGGTQWLNDAVLQRSVVWTSDLRWTLGDWQIYGTWKLGYVGNVLTLQDPGTTGTSKLDQYVKIFRPSSDGQAVATVSLGFQWNYDVSALQRSLTKR